MALYVDLISGDELLSSYYDTKEIDNCVYEAEGAFVTKKERDDFDIGANASAEAGDEEGVDASTAAQVINIVDNHRLNKMDGIFPTKKDFAKFIKDYLVRLSAKLKEAGKSPEEIEETSTAIKEYCKKIVKNFSEYEFYSGESMDMDAQMVMLRWTNNAKGEEAPFFYIWSKGVKIQKI